MVNTILAKRINHIVAKGGQSCLAKGVKVAWLFQGIGGIIYIIRNYSYANNEGYIFSISVEYDGGVSITQLSGYANYRLIDKIRVVYNNSGACYIDFHVSMATNGNVYRVSGILIYGNIVTPYYVSAPGGTSYEFSTVDGFATSRNLYVPSSEGNQVFDIYIQ